MKIFRNFIIVLMINFVFVSIWAQDSLENDCVAGEAKPQYSKQVRGIQNYEFSKPDPKTNFILESFDVPDLGKVTLSQGGCAHYGQTLTLKVKKQKADPKKFQTEYWIIRSKELLKKLPDPNKIEVPIHLNDFEKSLLAQKVNSKGFDGAVESTDQNGFYTFSLEVKEKGKFVEIQLSVDAAL